MTYKKIEMLEVTLRDGTYVLKSNPTYESCAAFIANLKDAGLEYIEVGYFRRRGQAFLGMKGPYVSDPRYLEILKGIPGIVLMVRPGEVSLKDYEELLPLNIKCIRYPINNESFDSLKPELDFLKQNGILYSLNIIRASEKSIEDIESLALKAEDLGASWIYIADSNGALFPSATASIFSRLSKRIKARLGFHGHNNISLAFANSITATENGATLVDSSIMGMGKGGNLDTELMALYLNQYGSGEYGVPLLSSLNSSQKYEWLSKSFIESDSMWFGMYDYNIDQIRSAQKEKINLPLIKKKENTNEKFYTTARR